MGLTRQTAIGSGIRNNEKKSSLCGAPIHWDRFCSYVFLSKHVWVNMKEIMKKNKSEPPADKKLIKKLHDKWCRANGYKLQASSFKPQASSLTAGPGDDRMNLERNI